MIRILKMIFFLCVPLGFTSGKANLLEQPFVQSISLLRGGGGIGGGFDLLQKSTDFVVGKDRELLHASIDLKWLLETLVNKQTWHGLYQWCIHRLLQMHPGYNAECEYRHQASQILREIYDLNSKDFSLRILQKSIHLVEEISTATQRPILLYCEEESDDIIPSLETFLFRRALASNLVGNEINRNFLLMACFNHHKYAKSLLDVINSDPTRQPLHAPFLLVLYPKTPPKQTSNFGDEHSVSIIQRQSRPFQITDIAERAIPSLKLSSSFIIGPIFSMSESSRDDSELRNFLRKISDRGKVAVNGHSNDSGVDDESRNNRDDMWDN